MTQLEQQLAALDAFATRDDAALAGSTRLRIRASLERGHAVRRHVSLLAALAVLLVASASWALATGRLRRWLTPPPLLHSAVPAIEVPADDDAPLVAAMPASMSVHEMQVPAAAPAPARHETQPLASASELLYTRAHELHFRGHDPAAALAAWDAYLAAEPTGTFAIEARYNRALCLVRLGQLADARRALEPFAHGDVEHGYRQPDAARLIERIDQRTAPYADARTNSLNGSP